MKQFALAAILTTVAATTVSAAEVASRKVTFPSNGETIVGTLYVPSDTAAETRRPGVIVAGAWTSIKEQMSGLYAKEMAERGFVALAFDYRGWGESSGTIRFKEDPAMKTADIIAAADFLSTLSEVDPDAINGLGICASAGYMADAVSGNPKFRSLSLVAPWLHNKAIVEQVYGGAENVAKLIAVSRSAERAEERGSPRVILAASATDESSLMYQIPYYTEADRGLAPQYDNKFNLGSWEPWLTYDSVATGSRVDKPVLLVHSEAAAVPEGAHAFLDLLKVDATTRWFEGVTQFDFYDRQPHVDAAADAVAEHIEKVLGRQSN